MQMKDTYKRSHNANKGRPSCYRGYSLIQHHPDGKCQDPIIAFTALGFIYNSHMSCHLISVADE